MHIQIINKQKLFASDEVCIARMKSLWQKIQHGDSTEKFTCSHTEQLATGADIYFEIITAKKLNVGISPATDDEITSPDMNESQFNDLHWITIEDHSSDHLDLITKFLLFIIGMTRTPNQTGCFMTDWADLRIALQYGNEARFINSNTLDSKIWSNAKIIASSIMLLNEDLPFKRKLEAATDLIPQWPVNQDYLNIMNITNTNLLPQTNMLLLVYNN